MFYTPLTVVINFESRYFLLLFFLAINPDKQDYYSFLDFRPINFQLACGTSVIREIDESVRKNPVFYVFSLNKIGKWPCHKREYALQNCKYVHIC